MSVLFCDTNCELWYDKAEELGLKVIKMPYILDGKEYYYDLGKETDFRFFYDKMRAKAAAKTAALNTNDYLEYFEPVFKEGNDIFYITFSHELSGTFEYMNQAVDQLKKKYPKRKFTMFNTKSISVGAALQVYYAAKKWKEGATDEQLVEFLEDFSPHIATYFVVDDLFHLKRGGRLSGAAATVGTLLKVKPILKITDEGKLNVELKEKGPKAITKLASIVDTLGDRLDEYDIYIIGADCPDEMNVLEDKIRALIGTKPVINKQIVGPVIASHCGPGTLGVAFYAKAR